MAIARSFLNKTREPDVAALVELYREAALELRERAQQRLVRDARKLTSEAKRARLLEREVAEILRELDAATDAWIAENIPRQYVRGVRDATLALREIGTDGVLSLNPGIHREAVEALVRSIQADMERASARILDATQRLVRRTQLEATVDKALTRAIAKGVIEGQARVEVSANIRNLLVDEFGEGPIVINGRRYAMDAYARMVARTKMAEAHSIGVVTRVAEAGVDLVMVSAHGADDACGFYEGKVFSVSGTHDKYPPLSELPNNGPPFHPNCIHRLLPFVEELASKREKERGAGVPASVLGKPYREVEKIARRRAA